MQTSNIQIPERTGTNAKSALTVSPLGKHIGADIGGVDLSLPLPEDTFQAIFEAWMKHMVLRFRNQSLSHDQLITFSRQFGELDMAPINLLGKPWVENYPELAVISNVKVDGQPVGSLGYGEAVWHTDMSYNEVTPTAAALYAVEVTRIGGLTGYFNMYEAYDSLSADLKRAVENVSIKHDSSRNSAGILRKGYKEVVDPREAPGAVHPAVIRHPVTGRRALFLGRRPYGYVVGMSLENSENLLNQLWAHVSKEELAWFQTWQVGDLVMWDNRCTMHKRTPFDAAERRLMYRTQIKGSRPTA